MAEYPNPEQNADPAGSTQMFRAFVDEGGTPRSAPRQAAPEPARSRTGLIVGIVVAVLVVAVAAYAALA